MLVRELRAGDEFVLDGVRVTVLAVEGKEVVLGITAPESARGTAPEGKQGPALRRGAGTIPASKN